MAGCDCTQKEKIVNIEERVSHIETTIHGNGSPGMKTDLALVKNATCEMQKSMRWTNRWLLVIMLGIIAFFVKPYFEKQHSEVNVIQLGDTQVKK